MIWMQELMNFKSHIFNNKFCFKMSWSLPINLKVKLSTAWTKYLEMLANSTSSLFSSVASSDLSGRVPNRNADGSDNVAESWELVLSILGEEEAVEEDGELKLVPIFLSLPSVLQLRFIFFLRSNISRISSCSVQTFLGKIDSCQRNLWMKEAVCQLRNAIARFSVEPNQLTEKTVTKYAFTSDSQNTLQNILSKLKNGKCEGWHKASTKHGTGTEIAVGNIVASKSIEDITVKSSSSISSPNPVTKSTKFSFPYLGEETTDVIIIDDDSTDCETTLENNSSVMTVDNTAKECCSHFNTLATCSKVAAERLDITSCSSEGRSNYGNSKQPAGSGYIANSNKDISKEQTTVFSNKLYLEAGEYPSVDSGIHGFGVQNLKTDRKRKFTEMLIATDDLIKCPAGVQTKLINKINEMETPEDLIVGSKSVSPAKILIHSDIAADSVVELSGNVMLNLDSIREACSSKENAFVLDKDIMNCFLEMEIAEIKMACTYLGLPQFSENALINFCDSIPWASLENESSVVLFDNCFSSKLTNLESQVSRILLMSLDSVSRIQPKALINVLVHILQVTHSGEFQCQVLTSVCKDFLPPDYFGYMLSRLSMEGPVMNEHLVNVLQTLIDKCADLDTDSLNHFHSLLTLGCQEVSSSAKFGKLLMAILRKYLKKMTSQQFITICALVESHSSCLRKPLQTLVKRCT